MIKEVSCAVKSGISQLTQAVLGFFSVIELNQKDDLLKLKLSKSPKKFFNTWLDILVK